MIKIQITLFLFLIIGSSLAQNILIQNLYDNYSSYKEPALNGREIKHADIEPLILELKSNDLFRIKLLGRSLEGRGIYLVSLGRGQTDILAWSQMHGDEPTATRAIFDILNFFKTSDNFNEFKKSILEKLTINFIPMLNPDGAQVYQRRNAVSVDLNRDALRTEFPESQILRSVRDSINPQFGFNLHDQSTRYSAGNSHRTATISFLAPAFNYDKTLNDTRKNTMKVIAAIYKNLKQIIPGHMGRYNDDFEPRAFGDNLVKWGTSSILIESGGWKNDVEKEFIRKLNFIALLSSFNIIADKGYESEEIATYYNIPENDKLIFDLLLKDLIIKFNGKNYIIDLGINRIEKANKDASKIYYKGEIADIGDLSIYYGNDEFDCSNMEVVPGKIYPEIFNTFDEIARLNFLSMLKQGYTTVRIKGSIDKKFINLPVNIVCDEATVDHSVKVENNANIIILKKNKPKFAVVNGYLYDLETKTNNVLNSLVFK